jgi:hypothetical protein
MSEDEDSEKFMPMAGSEIAILLSQKVNVQKLQETRSCTKQREQYILIREE